MRFWSTKCLEIELVQYSIYYSLESKFYREYTLPKIYSYANFAYMQQRSQIHSPVENQNDLELYFKVFSLLIIVVQAFYLMNPTDATLASLNVLKY